MHRAAVSEMTIIGAIIAISGTVIMIFESIHRAWIRAWIRAFGSDADYAAYLSQRGTMKNDKKRLIREMIGLILTILGIALFAYELGRLAG